MTVEMLDHLNMTVRSVDESTDWYRRVFGFESVEEGSYGGRPWRILKSGEAVLCIYEMPQRDHPSIDVHGHHGIKHFAFRIKDRDRWEQTVEKERLRLYYGGAIDYPHSQSWYVHDPNGYEIEVAAWDEGRARFD